MTSNPLPDTPTPLGGNRGVLTAAAMLRDKGEEFALAIVASTRGSTYRKPGALALLTRTGVAHGVISGGCLEPVLHDTAVSTLIHGAPQTLLLDTQNKDDELFGSGSACRGVMQVLVVPVYARQPHELYLAIDTAHRNDMSSKLALFTSHSRCAQGLVWSDNQTWQIGKATEGLNSLRDSNIGEHTLQTDGDDLRIAVFEIRRSPKILFIGAGPEAAPLMRIARTLGWFVTVIDHRAALLQRNAVDADHSIHARPVPALAELADHRFDAALIMTHTAAADLEALQALAPRNETYIGLLGPSVRRDELLNQLSSTARDAVSTRLHAPLGLRLGGDGPEPLALSIAAELQRFFTR